MSRLMQLRDAIVAAIAARLGGVEVAGHLGRFDDAELRQFLVKAPAVRVAVLALENPRAVSDDGVDYTARIGIYVVTKDGSVRLSRDEAAIAAVEAILMLCDRARWGLNPFVRAAESAAAQNLFSDQALKDGVALWAIDLRQPIRLSDPVDLVEPGAPPPVLWLGQSPDIGPGHEANYERFPVVANG